jgi:hypothetical protein
MSSKPPAGPFGSYPNETLIESDLTALRNEVEKLKDEANNKFQKTAALVGLLGGVLGLVSALVTLPKSFVETFNSLIVRPKTSLESNELDVNYDPTSKLFILYFPLYLKNAGNSDDAVHTVEGKLQYSPLNQAGEVEHQRIDIFDAGIGEFAFYDKSIQDGVAPGNRVPLPIEIGKMSGKNIYVSTRFDEGTFASAGENRLTVQVLTDHTSSENIDFCFYLDRQLIEELRSNGAMTTKRFLNPECGGRE